jgi:multiple inositol-polyphosphate phosphatase / 2,3-bisphosphoglycerate 3-phosphatase
MQSQPDSEASKFHHSQHFHVVLEEVSKRLGLQTLLTSAQIDLMWNMCRYEQAWQLETTSPWCVAFTPSHVDILTYGEDLSTYYTNGYGVGANGKIACSAMADMLTQLDAESGPQVVANFADATMVQLFLTALGAYHDKIPLHANNYDRQAKRVWRVGFVSPFASNIVAVKYGCDNATKVMFLHEQTPIEFEWCAVGLCDWDAVKEKYRDFQDKSCSDVIAQLNSGHRTAEATLLATALVLFTWKFSL